MTDVELAQLAQIILPNGMSFLHKLAVVGKASISLNHINELAQDFFDFSKRAA